MAGILDVREGAVWVASNSMYEFIATQLVAECAVVGDSIPPAVAEMVPQYPGDGGDWRSLRPDEVEQVHGAAERLMARLFAAGPFSMSVPEAFPAIMLRISELKAMLASDPRLAYRLQGQTVLHINAGAAWLAPAWLVRMVLEQVAARNILGDEAFAHDLLGVAVFLDPRRLALTPLDSGRFGVITLDVEAIGRSLAMRAKDSGDRFYRVAVHTCRDLHALLRRDPRAWEQTDTDIIMPLKALQAVRERMPLLASWRDLRFRIHDPAVLLFRQPGVRNADHLVPFGCYLAEYHRPRDDQGLIYRIEWNPEAGGSEAIVRQETTALLTQRGD